MAYPTGTYKIAASTKPKKKAPVAPKSGYILPYKQASRSAKVLAKALNLYRGASNLPLTMMEGKVPTIEVINWGRADIEGFLAKPLAKEGSRILNKPDAIALTRDKLKLFKHLKTVGQGRTPKFFETLEEAIEATDAGETVFGRSFTGSCGLDIVTLDQDVHKFNDSDFWVLYKKKKAEFRIHVFLIDGKATVVDRQQKVLRAVDPLTDEPVDRSKVNFMIRNHRNGFIFARNEIDVPLDVEVQALAAFTASGLDFGAVDVIWNEHEGKAYVLEINTAPGLEGSTVDTYVETFKKLGFGKTKVEQQTPEVDTATSALGFY